MNDTTTRPALPKRNPPDKDNVMTPQRLAWEIFQNYMPTGSMMDPCAGDGAFLNAMEHISDHEVPWCELRRDAYCWNGLNFFQHTAKTDWIISNPPYSILTPWLRHSFAVADNIVYLIQAPAPFFTARRRIAKEARFGIKEMHYVNCPEEWKKQEISFGGGLAAVYWKRGWNGGITETYAADFQFPKEQKRGEV